MSAPPPVNRPIRAKEPSASKWAGPADVALRHRTEPYDRLEFEALAV